MPADRNISSSDLDSTLQASSVQINGTDANTAINNAYATLGVPVNSTNLGTVVAPGLTSPNDNTVKQLLEKIAQAVSTTKATADQLSIAIAALINDGIVPTTSNAWSSAKTKAYLDAMIEDTNNTPNPKTTATYSQRVIEQVISQKFDAALADIEANIYKAV